MTPTFGSFSLQDENYLTENIVYRSKGSRSVETSPITRRDGLRLLGEQVTEKSVIISGIILSTSDKTLQSAVDDLQKALHTPEDTLVIESGRSYTATLEKLEIPDQPYTMNMVPFKAEFVCTKPYAEGTSQTASFVIPSGSSTLSLTTTISGSAPNRPEISFILPSGSGATNIRYIDVKYNTTANSVTVSGTLTRTNSIVLDYENFLVTAGGSNRDYVGQFEEIEPGTTAFTITLSGLNEGTRGSLSYSPRYW